LSENNTLQIEFILYGKTDGELDLQYQKFRPLYTFIIKSIQIDEKSKNKAIFTSTKNKL